MTIFCAQIIGFPDNNKSPQTFKHQQSKVNDSTLINILSTLTIIVKLLESVTLDRLVESD